MPKVKMPPTKSSPMPGMKEGMGGMMTPAQRGAKTVDKKAASPMVKKGSK